MRFLQLYKVVVVVLAGTLASAACGGDDVEPQGDGPDAASAAIDAAGPSIDSAPTPDADPAQPDAAGGDSLATTIGCGDETCDRSAQVCCFTGFPNITTTCTTEAACSNLPAMCDGPEDCGTGEVCCGDMTGAFCKTTDACTGFAAAQLCHTNDDCPESNNCHDSDFVAWPIC